jgi:outer membrane biosynthesis protein TonB
MRTDADQESETKPEDAPFHSDRNTRAMSNLPPDPTAPDRIPNVAGRDDLPFIEIRDRNYVDGDFQDASAVSQPSAPTLPSPLSAAASLPVPLPMLPDDLSKPQESKADQPPIENRADPADKPKEAPEAEPNLPDEARKIPETPAEKTAQPDAEAMAKAEMAEMEESFVDPFSANPMMLKENTADRDKKSAAEEPAEEKGEPAAPETPKPASSPPAAKPMTPPAPQTPITPAPPQPAAADIPPSPKPPSDTPAFTPETRAREMKGSAAKVGNIAAFDVEANAIGRYKKQVTQAVERVWHRYREKNAQWVTYGTLTVKFRVDKNGVPRNLKLVKNNANAVMAEFTLKAVLDADIPEMPDGVAFLLGDRGLEISYDVIIY